MVGIGEFTKAVLNAQMDSIYFCQLLNTCESKENGDAYITSIIFKPNIVKIGSVFIADVYYISLNGTGTAELALNIKTPDNKQIDYSYLIQPHYPGIYEEILDLETKSDQKCNDCVQWSKGIHIVELSNIYIYI